MEQRELDTKKNDKGFTLIELLIVIVILGILATVTVFAVRGITDQGKSSSCAADLKTVEVAIEAYYAQHGSAPDESDLVDDFMRAESTKYDVAAGAISEDDGSCTTAGVAK